MQPQPRKPEKGGKTKYGKKENGKSVRYITYEKKHMFLQPQEHLVCFDKVSPGDVSA
jgi:hypothetical protein